jgi:hypothetical protein
MGNIICTDIVNMILSFLSSKEKILNTSTISKNLLKLSRESVINFHGICAMNLIYNLRDNHLKLYPNLKQLSVRHNRLITNEGIKGLKLKVLNIYDCKQMNGNAIDQDLDQLIDVDGTNWLKRSPNGELEEFITQGNNKRRRTWKCDGSPSKKMLKK